MKKLAIALVSFAIAAGSAFAAGTESAAGAASRSSTVTVPRAASWVTMLRRPDGQRTSRRRSFVADPVAKTRAGSSPER